MNIENLLVSRDIPRLTGIYTHKSYDLMQHQFVVCNLFMYFAEKENINYTLNELKLVLNHDLVETATRCDLPYTIKNLNKVTKRAWEVIEEEVVNVSPELKPYSDKAIKEGLNEKQFALFKVCDYLDLIIFIKQEMSLGNNTKRIIEVHNNCLKLIPDICKRHKFDNILKFMEHYEA